MHLSLTNPEVGIAGIVTTAIWFVKMDYRVVK